MSQRKADTIIAIISISWGISYIFMKVGLGGMGPFNMLALRFGIAFLVMFPLFFKRLTRPTAQTLACSLVAGTLLFSVFTALLHGLQSTTASTSGFLTNTSVIFVPLLVAIKTRSLPQKQIVGAMILSLAGVYLLSGGDGVVMSGGALLVVLGAFFNGVYIFTTNQMAERVDTFQLGVYQLGIASTLGLACSFIFEQPTLPHNQEQWIAVMGLALICSAFGFVMQPIAQRYTTPERTSILFGLDAVFSSIFAFILLAERFDMKGYIGAALVLSSVFISGMKTEKKIVKAASCEVG